MCCICYTMSDENVMTISQPFFFLKREAFNEIPQLQVPLKEQLQKEVQVKLEEKKKDQQGWMRTLCMSNSYETCRYERREKENTTLKQHMKREK